MKRKDDITDSFTSEYEGCFEDLFHELSFYTEWEWARDISSIQVTLNQWMVSCQRKTYASISLI